MDEFLKLLAAMTPIVLGILTWRTEAARRDAVSAASRAASAANSASVATAEVQATLAVTNNRTTGKLDAIAQTADATHKLVNSATGRLLMANVVALRAVLKLTTDPTDKAAAEAAVLEAERLYDEHQAKQSLVDEAVAERKR